MKQKYVIIAAIVLLVGAAIYFSMQKPGDTDSTQISAVTPPDASGGDAQAATFAEQAASLVDSNWMLSKAPLSTDYAMGKADAPVKIIEYASLTCPHCADFANKHFEALKKKYIDTGKVLYILRPFPLNEPALKAATLVDCVGEKEGAARYYTFNHVLFDAQEKWAFDENFMENLQTFATVGGVPKEGFDACVNDIEREKKILKMRKEAADELQVNRTPFFFINGVPYKGRHSADAMGEIVDQLLAPASAAPQPK